MKGQFLQKVSGSLSKAAFKIKKASPELLIVSGAVGVVAAAVGACCATRKVDAIIDEHKAEVKKIHTIADSEEHPEYTKKDAQRDLTITYAQTGWKLIKLYGPSVLLGAASIGCMVGSNRILKKRCADLMAAYTAVDGAFKKYRQAVVERFGEAVDKELRFGTKEETIEEKVTDENGKEKKVKTKAPVQKGPTDLSCYAVCFDETNPNFKGNPDFNKTFLEGARKSLQLMYDARGYLFLNEVYDMLGFPRTRAGNIVGWNKKSKTGDGFIDFGIYDVKKECNRDFLNGYEAAVWLDFNVDGPILDFLSDIPGCYA